MKLTGFSKFYRKIEGVKPKEFIDKSKITKTKVPSDEEILAFLEDVENHLLTAV